MIAVTAHDEGAVLPVWAKPGSRHVGLIDEHDGALLVAVAAPAEDGRANEAIVRMLAETLNLRRSHIELLSGGASRRKRFLIRGIGPAELLDRIDAALEPTLFDPPDAEVG